MGPMRRRTFLKGLRQILGVLLVYYMLSLTALLAYDAWRRLLSGETTTVDAATAYFFGFCVLWILSVKYYFLVRGGPPKIPLSWSSRWLLSLGALLAFAYLVPQVLTLRLPPWRAFLFFLLALVPLVPLKPSNLRSSSYQFELLLLRLPAFWIWSVGWLPYFFTAPWNLSTGMGVLGALSGLVFLVAVPWIVVLWEYRVPWQGNPGEAGV